MKLYMINTIALKSTQEGYAKIDTQASNVYNIAVFSDDNEAMVASVKLGKRLLPYSEGWGSHESYIQEIKSSDTPNYRVTISVEKL